MNSVIETKGSAVVLGACARMRKRRRGARAAVGTPSGRGRPLTRPPLRLCADKALALRMVYRQTDGATAECAGGRGRGRGYRPVRFHPPHARPPARPRCDLDASHDVDQSLRLGVTYGLHSRQARLRATPAQSVLSPTYLLPHLLTPYTSVYFPPNQTRVRAVLVSGDTKLEPEVNLATGGWVLKAKHALSARDSLSASLRSGGVPALAYTRVQNGVELTVGAPLRRDFAAYAGVTVTRSVAL